MTYNNALKSCSHALNWTFTHPHPCSGSQQSYLSPPQDHYRYYTWQLTIKRSWRPPPPLSKKKEVIKGRNMTRMIRSPSKAHLVARYVNTQETSAKTLTFSVENERWGSRCGMTEAFIISLLKRCTMIYTTYS